jgi:hypothetical protein
MGARTPRYKSDATWWVVVALVITVALMGIAYLTARFEHERLMGDYRRTVESAGGMVREVDGDIQVEFNGPAITDLQLDSVSTLTQAHWLTIRGTRITDNGLSSIAGWKRLRLLNLERNVDITDSGLNELKGLSNLKDLNIDCCTKVTAAGVQTLQTSLPHCQISLTSACAPPPTDDE